MSVDLIQRNQSKGGQQFLWQVSALGTLETRTDISLEKSVWVDPSGSLTVIYVGQEPGGFFRLCQEGQIYVDLLPQRRLAVSAAEGISRHTIDHLISDQIIPRAMAHEGQFILHAGGIRLSDATILFMGTSGRGKSTLVASFDRSGFALTGDDATVIAPRNEHFTAHPIYPSLRLLPDSIDALLPEGTATTPVAHYSPKRRIDVPLTPPGDPSPLALRALFKLGEPSTDGSISISPLSIADTCISLIENSFMLDPTDKKRVRGQLSAASSIARRVPAYEICYPRDYSRLEQVQECILKHVA